MKTMTTEAIEKGNGKIDDDYCWGGVGVTPF